MGVPARSWFVDRVGQRVPFSTFPNISSCPTWTQTVTWSPGAAMWLIGGLREAPWSLKLDDSQLCHQGRWWVSTRMATNRAAVHPQGGGPHSAPHPPTLCRVSQEITFCLL